MLSGMILPPSAIDVTSAESREGDSWGETLELRVLSEGTAGTLDGDSLACEMEYYDRPRPDTVRQMPKKASGTAYHWHGSPSLSDTPTGAAAPVIVASQRIAVTAPTMSVRTSMFGAVAKFSDLPISA